MKTINELNSLANEINALSLPARLRLAADLLDRGKDTLASGIVERAATELGAAIALNKLRGKP